MSGVASALKILTVNSGLPPHYSDKFCADSQKLTIDKNTFFSEKLQVLGDSLSWGWCKNVE